jgi:hypothetical protein
LRPTQGEWRDGQTPAQLPKEAKNEACCYALSTLHDFELNSLGEFIVFDAWGIDERHLAFDRLTRDNWLDRALTDGYTQVWATFDLEVWPIPEAIELDGRIAATSTFGKEGQLHFGVRLSAHGAP